MVEQPATYEKIENFLHVSEISPKDLAIIKDKLNKGLTLAFLVTAGFDIHIGTTGVHKDIYKNLPPETLTMEKGRIAGAYKKITWETSDNLKNINIAPEDLEKLRAAIKQKINDALNLDYYLQ